MNHLQTEPNPPSINRPATEQEREDAADMLRTLGHDGLAARVEQAESPEDQEGLISVVSDFEDVDAQVLLVPPGYHHVPGDLLQNGHYFLGMEFNAARYPTLILHADAGDAINLETGESTPIHLCFSSSKMMNLVMDAPVPTVIETYIPSPDQFSDVYFNVQWKPVIDALNTNELVFYNGWPWALNAYGSPHRARSTLEKGLDGAHTGVMNTIDGIFRPLVKLGGALDRVFGLK